jgi:rubredoxin
MKKETYLMKLKCGNCGWTWEEEIEKGHLVKEALFGFNARVWEEIDSFEGVGREIICPNCGTKEEVRKTVE